MLALSAALAFACLSCTDRSPNLAEPPAQRAGLTEVWQCSVDVRGGTTTCTEPSPDVSQDVSLALLGNTQVKLRSANNSYDTLTLIYAIDVTVQNLLSYNIGTPDGQTRTGLKVFFEQGPYVTAYRSPGDTGTVTVSNPDGLQNFTASQQPYFFYDTILATQEITAAKRWEMRVPATVDRFGFAVRVFTATPVEQQVTTQAPDYKPPWFYNPAYSRDCGTLLSGMCLRNVILVAFAPHASQEERQSAVNYVKGKVIGGQIGLYFIQIPTPDTSYVRHLGDAISKLTGLPQVEHALPYLTTPPIEQSAFPYDTIGWREWRVNPDSADGSNWALEKVAAPLAWGCSWGDTLTTIGVVDRGYHPVSDVTRNSSYVEAQGAFPVTQYHGTAVAGILGGRGNDSSGIAGAMWRANMRLYDWTFNGTGDWLDLWNKIRNAGMDGARVINMSVGYDWRYDPDTVTNPAKQAADRAIVRQLYLGFRTAMDTLVAHGRRPLVVVSAGNSAIDAKWNAGRVAVDSVTMDGQPFNLIVVAATNIRDQLYTRSNRGSLVRVAAPGDSVHVLNGQGTIVQGSGTSYAAPMVAGVAGMLFAFDNRLTAADVKQLIITGAVNGARSAAGIPILNAYESVKLAAQRTGAPLCGNRLWSRGDTLFVQRQAGRESLLRLGNGYIRKVDAMHGGKRIRLITSNNGNYSSELQFANGNWLHTQPVASSVSYLTPVSGSGGSFNAVYRTPGVNLGGVRMYSHGADTLAEIKSDGLQGQTATVYLTQGSGSATPVATLTAPFQTSAAVSQNWCMMRYKSHPADCATTVTVSSGSRLAIWGGGFFPTGGRLAVTVTETLSQTEVGDSWYDCPTPPGDSIRDGLPDDEEYECRGYAYVVRSGFAWLHSLRLAAPTLQTLWTDTLNIQLYGISEDGREVLAWERKTETRQVYDWYLAEIDHVWYRRMRKFSDTSTSSCALRFREMEAGASAYVAIAPLANCNDVDVEGAVAPNRAPTP